MPRYKQSLKCSRTNIVLTSVCTTIQSPQKFVNTNEKTILLQKGWLCPKKIKSIIIWEGYAPSKNIKMKISHPCIILQCIRNLITSKEMLWLKIYHRLRGVCPIVSISNEISLPYLMLHCERERLIPSKEWLSPKNLSSIERGMTLCNGHIKNQPLIEKGVCLNAMYRAEWLHIWQKLFEVVMP